MANRVRVKLKKKVVKVRRNNALSNNNSGDSISSPKMERVRRSKPKHICYVCNELISGPEVYVGCDKYRCYDCYPGSSSYLKSEVGLNSPNRKYFLTDYERKREGIILGNKEIPDWMKKNYSIDPPIERVRRVVDSTEERVRRAPKRMHIKLKPLTNKVKVKLKSSRVRLKCKELD